MEEKALRLFLWLVCPVLLAYLFLILVLILAPGTPIHGFVFSGPTKQGVKIVPMCAGKPVVGCGKAAGELAKVRSTPEWREDDSNKIGELQGDQMAPTLGPVTGGYVLGANNTWYAVCWQTKEGSWVEAYVYSTTLNEEGDISKCMPKRSSASG